MASYVTNKCVALQAAGTLVYASDTIKALLLTSASSPNQDVNFIDELTANESALGGYSRQTLTTKTVTEDDANNQVEFSSDNLAFGTLATGETLQYCAIFKDTGTPSTSPVMAIIDFTATPTNGSTFTLTPHADGWFKGAT